MQCNGVNVCIPAVHTLINVCAGVISLSETFIVSPLIITFKNAHLK